MRTLNRKQFADEMNRIIRNDKNDCNDPDHFVWKAEQFAKDHRIHCNWFVCVKPIDTKYEGDDPYWPWIGRTLTGDVACFSSDKNEEQEWWGFTDEKDVTLWCLKWAA